MTPVGHLALGFALKPAAPRVHLGILLAATWLLDLLYIGLAFLAHEPFGRQDSRYMPWTHGLAGALLISALAAAAFALYSRERRAGLMVGVATFSHWLLDFVMWDDLPLITAGSPSMGLGLLSPERPGQLLFVEAMLFAAGVTLYAWHRRRRA